MVSFGLVDALELSAELAGVDLVLPPCSLARGVPRRITEENRRKMENVKFESVNSHAFCVKITHEGTLARNPFKRPDNG
jgi:hypothetical protein